VAPIFVARAIRRGAHARFQPQQKAPPSGWYGHADVAAPKLATAIARGLAWVRQDVDMPMLVQAVQNQDEAQAVRALHSENIQRHLTESITPVMSDLGRKVFRQAAVKTLPATVAKADGDGGISSDVLDQIDWYGASAAEGLVAQLVTAIDDETRLALEAAVHDEIAYGLTPTETARLIRDRIGLNDQQAQALESYRQRLLASGMSSGRMLDLTGRYADRLLNERTFLITRTETVRASSAAQSAWWDYAEQQGILQPDAMDVLWISTPDSHECPICDDLDGTRVAYGESFETSEGESVDAPPAHPACRCTVNLVSKGSDVGKRDFDFLAWAVRVLKGEPEGHDFRGNQYTGGISGGDVVGPRPERTSAPESWSDDQKMAHWAAMRERDQAWEHSVRVALSLGKLTQEQANLLGYHAEGRGENWQPLPHDLYHVTTDVAGVEAKGLMTRDELGQQSGAGLGGGDTDTISFSTDAKTADEIKNGLLEMRQVARGDLTPAELMDRAAKGDAGSRPFLSDIARYGAGGNTGDKDWQPGQPLPRSLQSFVDGTKSQGSFGGGPPDSTPEDMKYDWKPAADSYHWTGGDGKERYSTWTRTLNQDERRQQAVDFYKTYSFMRGQAGGPEDPLFFTNDTTKLAGTDPNNIGVLRFQPVPGAQGFQMSAMGEWRVASGKAVVQDRSYVNKGEASGHPFRGNQYISGETGGLAITVPDDPRFYGDPYVGQHMTGGRQPIWNPETGKYSERIEAQPNVAWVRGTPISPNDPRIPDTLYHVSPRADLINEQGVIRAGGEGGLGGDANDRIVSLTTDPEIAAGLERDLKMVASVARDIPLEPQSSTWDENSKQWVDTAGHEVWGRQLLGRLQDAAKQQGWTYNASLMRGNQPDVIPGVLASNRFEDQINGFFQERQGANGMVNPLFVGRGQTDAHWRSYDPLRIGTLRVPKASLQTGAMISDLDMGRRYGLSEIRAYGDVPLNPNLIQKGEAEGHDFRGNQYTGGLPGIDTRAIVDRILAEHPNFASGTYAGEQAARWRGVTNEAALAQTMTFWRSGFANSSNVRALLDGREMAPAFRHDFFPYFAAEVLKQNLTNAPALNQDTWRMEMGKPAVGSGIDWVARAVAGSRGQAEEFRSSLIDDRYGVTVYHLPADARGLWYPDQPAHQEAIVQGNFAVTSALDDNGVTVAQLQSVAAKGEAEGHPFRGNQYVEGEAGVALENALRRYTSMGYATINARMRGQTLLTGNYARSVQGQEDAKNADQYIASMHAAMRPLTEPLTVYRGINRAGVLQLFNTSQPDAQDVGTEFMDKAFVSTSRDSAEGYWHGQKGGAMMEIHVPAGTPALDVVAALGHDLKNEEEVVLQDGAHFRLDSVDTVSYPLDRANNPLQRNQWPGQETRLHVSLVQ
jgi:hypothetical protein